MRQTITVLCSLVMLWAATGWAGVQGFDVAVQVSAQAQAAPPKIVLSWPVAPSEGVTYKSHTIYRKDPADNDWGKPIAVLPGTAEMFADSAVRTGVAYEYQVIRDVQPPDSFRGYGYVCAGIQVPAIEARGKIILLVESKLTEKLKTEIIQLQQDLVGDGWQVLRRDVDAGLKDYQIKSIIANDYHADPAHVQAAFLLGHIAVPYSGNIDPDGHDYHQGAWPADMYYGDLTGTWTDTTVDNHLAKLKSPRNYNVPGDGKWDQDHLPNDGQVVIQVGRVDLSNLPAFAAVDPKLDEIDLLARYLDKDHRYRHNLPPFDTVRPRALIPVSFNGHPRPYFLALSAVSDALLGHDAFDVRDWPKEAATDNTYLWGFGYAVGGYTSVAGVTDTKQLANGHANVVFAMLMGSLSGDWDTPDNVVRAMLASQPMCLAVGWGGQWYFQHMAMGQTIGYAVRLTQNNRGFYPNPWATPYSDNLQAMVHIALQGDPTLRLMPVSAATGLTAVAAGGAVKLTLTPPTAPPQDIRGYYIYRAANADGPFVRISPDLVKELAFTDATPPAGSNVYMVRALKLQTTGGGTFFNLSQGVFAQP